MVPMPSLLTSPMIDASSSRQPRIRVDVVERAEQLLLGVHVAGGAIAADADADGAGRAALALRLPDRVQDALAHAFERAVGAPEVRQLRGQRVLRVHVLAAAALENQLHLDLVVVLPLLEVDDRRARAEVVARVLAGERVDGVRPQLAAPVASATASRICFFITIWLAPTGVLTSKVGMPVSWQMAPSPSAARSMFCAMIASACADCVPASSRDMATFMAARTSGGRSVDVRTTSDTTLSKN